MLTGYLERDHLMGLCWHTFKNYADRLFRKRSSHGPMLAYLMLHLQVGIRTQTRTQIAILSLGVRLGSNVLFLKVFDLND